MDQYLTKNESANRTTFCDEMLLVLRAPLKAAIYLLLFRLLLPSLSFIFTVQIYDKLQMVLGTAVKISVHKKVAWALNEWLYLQKMKAKKLFNRFKPVTTCDDAWRRQHYDDSVTSTSLRRQCDVDSVKTTVWRRQRDVDLWRRSYMKSIWTSQSQDIQMGITLDRRLLFLQSRRRWVRIPSGLQWRNQPHIRVEISQLCHHNARWNRSSDVLFSFEVKRFQSTSPLPNVDRIRMSFVWLERLHNGHGPPGCRF